MAQAAKSMTKAQIAAALADRVGITRKQATRVLEVQADLVYKHLPRRNFVLPGIGKLVLMERPARTMVMGVGPDKGKQKLIPSRKVLKFRIAKAARDALLGPGK